MSGKPKWLSAWASNNATEVQDSLGKFQAILVLIYQPRTILDTKTMDWQNRY